LTNYKITMTTLVGIHLAQHGSESPQCSSITTDKSESGDRSLHFMNKFHKYRASKSVVESKSKIDQYLMEDAKKVLISIF
jgi:hypothetical protein